MNRLFLKITVVSLLCNLNCFAMNDPHNFGTRFGLTTDNIKLANDVNNTLVQGIGTVTETIKTLDKIATQTNANLDKITDKTFHVGIAKENFDHLDRSVQQASKELNATINNLTIGLKESLDRIDAMDKEVEVTITNIGDANRFVKTTGICLIGLTGSSAGIFLMYKGFNKAFIDNDDKNDKNDNNPGNNSSWNSIKPYVINNYTTGLLTAGIGAGMVYGGLKMLCNSDKVLGYLS